MILGLNKNTFLLLALISLILTPVYYYVSGFESPKLLIIANFLFVFIGGYNVCSTDKINWMYISLAIIVLGLNVSEYLTDNNLAIICFRVISTAVLFAFIFRSVMLHLINEKKIVLDSILGSIAGYLLIGLFAGMVYEFLYHLIPNSFNLDKDIVSNFQFFYFSFTGITTVGFGDVAPTNPQSQSITILMNITGQMYLTIVMALFVGKFMANRSENKS